MVHASLQQQRLLVVVLATLGGVSCATTGGSEAPTRIGEDTYRVRCATALATCLAKFSSCPKGFTVVEGHETRDKRGPEPMPDVFVDSEAVLRCRRVAVFGSVRKEAPAPTASDAGPRDQGAASTCFPGSTQACLGPAACSGAQTCLPGGAAFGPCDCGGERSAPASAPSSPPAASSPAGEQPPAP